MRGISRVGRAALVVALLATMVLVVGCDKFPAYQLYVTNNSGAERILILTYRTSDLERQGLPTYVVPPDSVNYETEVVLTRGPAGDDADQANVFVFDSECKLLETIPVVSHIYQLSLESRPPSLLEPLSSGVPADARSLGTATEQCSLP